MSFPPTNRQTILPSHLRTTSSLTGQSNPNSSHSASNALAARVAEKRAELAQLKELQRLSASVSDQMHMLEEKLGTLADGTEAVATVLANWGSVLRAIGLASCKFSLRVGGVDGG